MVSTTSKFLLEKLFLALVGPGNVLNNACGKKTSKFHQDHLANLCVCVCVCMCVCVYVAED
jgi:hypothetical protein